MTMHEHTREIDGSVWTTVLFPGRQSLRLFRQLTALGAEPLQSAADTIANSVPGIDEDISVAEILRVLGGVVGFAGKLADNMSDEEFEALAERLLSLTKCDGSKIAFDDLFQGRLPTLLKVLAFVVEVNFAGPFAASLGPMVSSAFARFGVAVPTLTSQPS